MRAHTWAHRGEHTQESTKEENWFQDREAQFVRACAVETHMNISKEPFCAETYRTNAWPQATLQEAFCVEICRKNAGPVFGERCLIAPVQSKTWTFHKSHFVYNLQENDAHPFWGPRFVRAPAQSRRTWTLHKRHFAWKFTGKMPDPPVNTSIEHRAFYTHRKTPFSVATLLGDLKLVIFHSYVKLPGGNHQVMSLGCWQCTFEESMLGGISAMNHD